MGDFNNTKAQSITAANIDITELRSHCDQACKVLLSVSVICLGGEEYDNYSGIIKMLDVAKDKVRKYWND